MIKLSNLIKQDARIVENKKWIFLVPAIVVVLALIMGVVFHFSDNSALNLGMDFVGGYTINVDVGANLTEENSGTYKQRVTEIVESYVDDEGNSYGIRVSQILVSGSGDDTALQVRFKSIANDEKMQEIVDGIIEEIKAEVTVIRPSISREGNVVTAVYTLPLDSLRAEVNEVFVGIEGASNLDFGAQYSKQVTFTYTGDLDDSALSNKLGIQDVFAANVYDSGKVGAVVSQDLLYNALSAIIIALVLMLVYIAIRFELKSGIAAIGALVHDLVVMFSFMTIFHIEFNSTFIAALITILGYSINNSIILFDRVRSNTKLYPTWDVNAIANKSISQSFVRCMNTTITTVIMIGSVAIVCAIASIFNADLYQMVTFSLPIIIGLISGFFSALFVAPSIWVLFGKNKSPKTKAVTEAKE